MRNFRILFASLALAVVLSFPSFAGSWQQDTIGWKYQDDNGSYITDSWKWIDGNNDGIAENYCFGSDGYMLINCTTPDGYTVDATGTWILNNIVQTQATGLQAAQTTGATTTAPTSTNNNTASPKKASAISASPYEGYTIVVNTNTMKYHVPGCKSVSDMSQDNKGYCSDAAYLNSQGYAACKRCH